jgi:hypothetical protein
MPIIYAASADLAEWLSLTGTPMPDYPGGFLRTASMAVTEAMETGFYAVDSTGLPTDAKTLQAFKDATCAQAAALIALEIDPAAGGILQGGQVEQAVQLLSARVQFADSAAAVEGLQQILGGIVPESARCLKQAGLVVGVPWIVG